MVARRFRFRLRTLLVGVAIVCVALAVGRWCTTPHLYVEAVDDEHTKFSGRFFMLNGSPQELAYASVFYTSQDGKRSRPVEVAFVAKQALGGVYPFSETCLISMISRGRYDVRLSTGFSPNPRHDSWFSFGDQNLPSCRDESLGPLPEPLPPLQRLGK